MCLGYGRRGSDGRSRKCYVSVRQMGQGMVHRGWNGSGKADEVGSVLKWFGKARRVERWQTRLGQ